MSQEAWPTPQAPSREPLPRVEDLPVADQGYEQESVKAAFDSFYRHAAQLDAALRTLEAVDSFQRQAAALRADLRSLRAAGWTQQPWAATPAYASTTRAPREGISPVVWRIAGEAAFIIAVAVALGVAQLSWWVIVLVMAAAWLIVGTIEWAASRERFFAASPAPVSAHPVVEAEPVGERTDEAESSGWTAFEEAQEPSDAMTIIGAPAAEEAGEEPEPGGEAAASEPEAVEAADEPESEEEPMPQAGRRWFRRHREEVEDAQVETAGPPRHVRVLSGGDRDSADPWERGFDAEPDEALAEPGEETDGDEAAVSTETSRRRFRRR